MVLKVALVGLGKMGGFYLDNLLQMPGMDLVGICDNDEAKVDAAKKRVHGLDVKAYSTCGDMKAALEPDLLVVATPTPTHFDILCDAILSGVNVFMEKPACLTMEEAEKLKELPLDGHKIAIGYLTRFSPVIEEARRFFSDNLVEPFQYNVTWIKNRTMDTRSHYGVVRQEAIHPLDLILYSLIGSENLSVSKSIYLDDVGGNEKYENEARFHLRIADLDVRMFVSFRSAASKRNITISCKDPRNGEAYQVFLTFDNRTKTGYEDRMAVNVLSEQRWYNLESGKLVPVPESGEFKSYPVNKLRDQLYAMEKWVTHGLYDHRICTLDQALANVKLCNAILEQSRNKPEFVKVRL